MENVIIIAVVAVIVGCIVRYLYKARKKGKTCIGCPYSDSCQSKTCNKT